VLTVGRARGVSLIELLIVLALLGVAAGALSRIATHQQRSYRQVAARTAAHAQLREGNEVLASELAGISPGAGDIYDGEMHDGSIAFRSVIGTYLLCGAPAEGTNAIDAVRVESATTSGDQSNDDPNAAANLGGVIEALRESPSVGDSLWIHDTGSGIGGSDDQWRLHAITAVGAVRRRCPPAADSGETAGYRMTIVPGPSSTLAVHAPLRLFRRARYALYQSGDGNWYLGFSDCRPVVRNPPCSPMQPVSGPYLPAATGAAAPSGLTFVYLDRTRAPTTDPAAVAAIELVLRASTGETGTASDTIVVRRVIALRNTER
jgi:prepilin-type N-terminal cleavage/methylation domain-containing protein